MARVISDECVKCGTCEAECAGEVQFLKAKIHMLLMLIPASIVEHVRLPVQ